MNSEPSVSPEKIAWMESFAPTTCGQALDLGCGPGLYARWLTKRGWDVDALDLRAPPPVNGVRVLAHNLEQGIPFPSGSFGLLLAWDIIEHVANEESLWKEIHRVLRLGGVLVGSVPHNADRRLQRYNLTFKHHVDKTHQREYSPEEVDGRMRSARLTSVAVTLKGPVSPQVLSEFVRFPAARRPVARLIGLARRLGMLTFGELYGDIFFTGRKEASS